MRAGVRRHGLSLPDRRSLCDNLCSGPFARETSAVPALLVIQGRDQGSRFDLTTPSGVVSIGREAGNTVQLDDHEISRRHAEIHRVGDAFVVGDLGSSNGTYVNERRVERAELSNGDRIRLGRTVLGFALDEAVERAFHVDVIPPAAAGDGSRIVRTMREEDSIALAAPGQPPGHWLSRARSNLQVMYRTSLAVSHTLDIDELLARILELVFEWVEADRGCIMLLDPETRQLEAKARRDRQAGTGGSLAISRTILDHVLTDGEGVLTSDAQEDDRFAAGNSVVRTGVREAICVPMRGRYDTVGVIYVDTTTPLAEAAELGGRRFTDEHLKLMIAIGHQAALAVEDTNFYSAKVQSERLAAVGQAIAAVSHHIKNILQGIRGGDYLVELGLENEDLATVRKGWEIVRRNQGRISSLVMDMLSFSKEREPDLAPGDLAEVVADVVETVSQRARESGVTIRVEPASDAARILLDAEAISRAVLNVVINALDALEGMPRGTVTISTAVDRAAGMARITVADDGPGMTPETLAGIFNLFMSTKGARGTGLGLTVSRKILREHGGDIRVMSDVGRGSTFTLEWPLRLPVEPPAAGAAAGTPAAAVP